MATIPSFVSSFTAPSQLWNLKKHTCQAHPPLFARMQSEHRGAKKPTINPKFENRKGNSSMPSPPNSIANKGENKNSSDADWREPKIPSGKIYAPRQVRGGGRRLVGNVRTQGKRYIRLPPNPPGLRISAGSARGRALKSPDVYLRPMMSKVREALFSMLDVFGAIRQQGTVLDLYCGSGSVGIEALSRGMGRASFVDYAPECIETTSRNLEACQFSENSDLHCSSVKDFLSSWKERKKREDDSEFVSLDKNVINRDYYDLITITPPYEEVDYSILMQQVVDSGCVGPGTFVVVEYPVEIKAMPPTIAHRLIGIRNRKYGRTVLAVYACQPPVDLEPRPDEFSTGRR